METLLAKLSACKTGAPENIRPLLPLLDATDRLDATELVKAVPVRPCTHWARLLAFTFYAHELAMRLLGVLPADTARILLEKIPGYVLPTVAEALLRHKVVGPDALVEMALSRGEDPFLSAVAALYCRHPAGTCPHYRARNVTPDWWRPEVHAVAVDLPLRGDGCRWTAEHAQAAERFRDAHLRPSVACLATVRPILSYRTLSDPAAWPPTQRSSLAPQAALLAWAAGVLHRTDVPLLVGVVLDGPDGREPGWLRFFAALGVAAAGAATGDFPADFDARLTRRIAPLRRLPRHVHAAATRVVRKLVVAFDATARTVAFAWETAPGIVAAPGTDAVVVALAPCDVPGCRAANRWAEDALTEDFPALSAAVRAGGGTLGFDDLPGKEILLLLRNDDAEGGSHPYFLPGQTVGHADHPLPHIALLVSQVFHKHHGRRRRHRPPPRPGHRGVHGGSGGDPMVCE
jgi:hypothetical protein